MFVSIPHYRGYVHIFDLGGDIMEVLCQVREDKTFRYFQTQSCTYSYKAAIVPTV